MQHWDHRLVRRLVAPHCHPDQAAGVQAVPEAAFPEAEAAEVVDEDGKRKEINRQERKGHAKVAKKKTYKK